MEKINNLLDFLGVSTKEIEKKFGSPTFSHFHPFEDDSFEMPYHYFKEDIQDVIYSNIIDLNNLSKSNTIFHISKRTAKVRGITLTLNFAKYPEKPKNLLGYLGLIDIGKPDENFGDVLNWFNYKGNTVTLMAPSSVNFVGLDIYANNKRNIFSWFKLLFRS